ncbi:hypothetical protein [Sabulicella rubraurantiaca]|uniref:hypothetical protein n=1 Tax=Sabulicella rubraurantiaca TaxID=2811429 RepID=UPI001A956C4C|nr:hypothetical protein [Sabulicella rubraurantiaca]
MDRYWRPRHLRAALHISVGEGARNHRATLEGPAADSAGLYGALGRREEDTIAFAVPRHFANRMLDALG